MVNPPSTRATAVVGTLLAGVALLAGFLVWDSLPARMVVHWGPGGSPDGFAPRSIGVTLLPLLALFLLGLLLALPRVDPLGENVESYRGRYNGFVLLFVGFLAALQIVLLGDNLGYAVPIGPVVLVFAGLLAGFAGTLLGRLEPSWFLGIRTPWTMSSETVWRRTHDIASPLFVVAGAICLLAAALLALGVVGDWVVILAIGAIVLAAVIPGAYSYYLYEALEEPADRPT